MNATCQSMLTRRRAVGTGLGAGLATLARTAGAAGPELKGSGKVTMFDGGGAWGAAQRKAYFEPFQKLTGIEVVAVPRAPAGKFETSIRAGAPSYEVGDISAALLGPMGRSGLLLPIDYQWFDPDDRAALSPVPAMTFGVPTLFYSLIMAFDPAKVKQGPPPDWAGFWDVKRFPGPRALGNGARGAGTGTFEAALMADGVAPDKLYPLDLDRVFRSLDRIKPSIVKYWDTGAEPVQMLIDGNVAFTSAWNGRIAERQLQGAPVDMSWNQGILQWDALVVAKGAKNVENAMKFIAFTSRPEQQARFSQLITYGPTNTRAATLIPPDRARILSTSPELVGKQVVQNYDWWGADSGNGKSNEQVASAMWERWITS